MRLRIKDGKHMELNGIDDLKLALNYLTNFSLKEDIEAIFSNPSFYYFKGISQIASLVENKKGNFYYGDENKIEVCDLSGSYSFVIKPYIKDGKKIALLIDYVTKNIRIDNYLTMLRLDKDIIKIETKIRNGFKLKAIDEYSEFDSSGLEIRNKRDNGSYIDLKRCDNGYLCRAEYLKENDCFSYITYINIDTNSPLLTFSMGQFISADFLEQIINHGSILNIVKPSDAERYISNNSDYLSEDTKNALLYRMKNKNNGVDDIKLKSDKQKK